MSQIPCSDLLCYNAQVMNVSFATLGCKVNRAQTEELIRTVVEHGYSVIHCSEEADAFVVNTCTVTSTADAKGRRLLRHLHHQNPEAMVIATGCYARRDPESLKSIDGVGFVIPQCEKNSLLAVLRRYLGPPNDNGTLGAWALRTRALVRIQDGCNLGCTYCIVPSVRGHGRSWPADSVVAELNQRFCEGYQEAVLTGIDIGSYRWNDTDLAKLVTQILARTEMPRLRLTSLHPGDLSPHLLSSLGNPRVCQHFHLPLQSGSNRVLRAMGRRYSIDEFRTSVANLRAAIPNVSISTDVIVGFPGETDRDFEGTIALCHELTFSWIHVFPFSARPGTPAALLPPMTERDKTQRTHQLLALAKQNREHFYSSFSGQSMPVLWEKETMPNVWSGLTPNYIRVCVESRENLKGSIRYVKLGPRKGYTFWGVMSESP